MKKILKNESGSVILMVAALLVCLISLASSVSLLGIVSWDTTKVNYAHDAVQEELFMRTESTRTHMILEQNPEMIIPPRKIKMTQEGRKTTYKVSNKKEIVHVTLFMGLPTQQAVSIQTLIEAERCDRRRFKSPVKRFSEKLVKSKSLAEFQYFTNSEKSENEDGGFDAGLVKFWGPDVLWGPLHSNDDIWIQQAGGGTNDNWPTFHAMVTTAKLLKKYPGGVHLEDTGAPMDEIFLGGYAEGGDGDGINPIVYNPTADLIRENGMWIGDENAEIVYVKINGSSFEYKNGDIVLAGIDTFGVYSWYPHNAYWANYIINAGGNWYEDSDHIYTNHVPVYDTVWSHGGTIALNNQSVFVDDAQLWIEGDVCGAMTFGCSDTIFIVGDITYENTYPGQPPDDPLNPNETDFFGLVSEKKVIIRYKHRDPFDGMSLRDDNCNDIMLYGAYAAIGIGDVGIYGNMACHYDGIFTFQYQHPHGSTPSFWAPSPYTGNDTLYDYVDLHKYIFPINEYIPQNILGFNLHGNIYPPGYQTCGFPYESQGYIGSYPNNNSSNYAVPYGTDHPWYNPVWPESSDDIVFERGIITVFGAIGQTRRGFVHRSGQDPYNHPNDFEWDIPSYHFDGKHNGLGDGTGYDKDYHYDNRFLYIQPPDYPEIYEDMGGAKLTAFEKKAWVYKSPSEWDK